FCLSTSLASVGSSLVAVKLPSGLALASTLISCPVVGNPPPKWERFVKALMLIDRVLPLGMLTAMLVELTLRTLPRKLMLPGAKVVAGCVGGDCAVVGVCCG